MIATLAFLRGVPSWAYGILILLAVGVGIEFHGRAHVQNLWDADRAEIARISQMAIAAATARNDQIKKQQTQTVAKLKKANQDEIAKNRAYRASHTDRLRIAADCSGTATSPDTQGSSGSAATVAGTCLLPITFGVAIRSLMLEADNVVAGCRAAQNFIIENGMAP